MISGNSMLRPSVYLYRNIRCSNCDMPYSAKDFSSRDSRRPMLLQCGHSLCEACLQQNVQSMKTVTCGQCNFVSTLDLDERTNEYLPLNLYVAGLTLLQQNIKSEKGKKLSLLTASNADFGYEIKGQEKTNSSRALCEECSSTAMWTCENCTSNLCEFCWVKIHISAKSLIKHKKMPLSSGKMFSKPLPKCSIHETQSLKFYCKNCDVPVCSYCIVFQHQGEGHSQITLKDKNLEIFPQLKAAAENAESTYRQMKRTAEKLREILFSFTPNPRHSVLENEITKKFSVLHGILQLEEDRILKMVYEVSTSREKCLKRFRAQLESNLEKIESLLSEYNSAGENLQNDDMAGLLEKLYEIRNLPCYLVFPESSTCETEGLKVTFDNSLIDAVRNYCTVHVPHLKPLELVSRESLPNGYLIDPPEEKDWESKDCLSERNSRNIDSASCSEAEIEPTSSQMKMEPTDSPCNWLPQKPSDFVEKRIYSVSVTYIKSPGEFFVNLTAQETKQKLISKMAEKFAKFSARPVTVAKGEIFLVQYKVDGKWYRARVVDVFPSNDQESSAFVYYLDYGNTEQVTLSRIKTISDELLEYEPLAIKCKLFDCIPKNGKWCLESVEIMATMLENSKAMMFVMNVHPDCLEVDLSKTQSKNQMGSEIVSVRDALVFLDFANLVGGYRKSNPTNSPARYLPQSLPSVGETLDVIVTHVDSLSNFYVQRVDLNSYAQELTVDMQNYYSSNSRKGIIYNPSVGMICAAKFSVDHKWYRASVVSVKKKQVKVRFVDYGNKETIPWTSIRKLQEKFIKLPPMALLCSLAEIRPAGSRRNLQTSFKLKNTVEQKECRIQVKEKTKSKEKMKVFLCLKQGTTYTRVNDILLKKNIFQSGAAKNRSEEAESSDDDSASLRTEVLTGNTFGSSIAKGDESFFKDRKAKPSAKKLREIHETGRKSDEVDEKNFSIDKKDIYKVKVQILSAETPSSFYATVQEWEEVLKELQLKLNEFYETSEFDKSKEWTVDSKCAVYSEAKGGWYRATVLNLLPDDKVEVFLKDIAYVSKEPISSLRILDPSFFKYAPCAIKCHLADICPVGDQWPGLSCEVFISELEKYDEVFMTRKGTIDGPSLPVELWVQKIVPGSALEPTYKECTTINRILVEQGLAIPVASKLMCLSASNENAYSTDENKVNSEENIEETEYSGAFVASLSSQWLPRENLKQSHFVGMPTYVDSDGGIYAYDVHEDEEKLTMIREALLEEHANSQPGIEDQCWSPGQLCIVKYHMDNFWYRGKVLERNPDLTYEVLFVDYGNVETCHIGEMRKKIKMEKIPILTHKFQLHGVAPLSEDGNWDMFIIDILHSLIVTKFCEINVLKESQDPDKPSIATFKIIEKNIDIGQLLVNKNLARYVVSPGSKRMVNSKAKEDICVPKYTPLSFPFDCTKFDVKITNVLSSNEFFGTLVFSETLPFQIQKAIREYELLRKELENFSLVQPNLKIFTAGQPCCCLNFECQEWQRAEIESSESAKDSVLLFYVDHGGKNNVKKNLLRECRSEWLNIPKMSIRFKLTSDDDYNAATSLLALEDSLKEEVFHAEIVNMSSEFLHVKLEKLDGLDEKKK